ncbi:L-rhamnose-binding lectin SML-like [Stylophora pistillata]|uniref:L-rhamnose-binding lectin SML-like n=1 Tax=Stylophora pistillata TaxID=50429 RepID=UPI000C04916C|nr:L-rhamnose-binding lectin SML-like [Stylophora pistillata]
MVVFRKKPTMSAVIVIVFMTIAVVHDAESASEFFVETICDGEPARTLRCPKQNVLSTVWASYGRLHNDICIDGEQLINVTCKVDFDTVLATVQETCDDSNTCELESSKDAYGDPPECRGVKKYLQVYYLCKSELIKKSICEFNPPENITCPEAQTIEVVNANYGRTDKWTCGEQLADNNRCTSPNSDQIVKEKCNGQNVCELEASNEAFGNPCGQTHKYLQVDYHCQTGKIINKSSGEMSKMMIMMRTLPGEKA